MNNNSKDNDHNSKKGQRIVTNIITMYYQHSIVGARDGGKFAGIQLQPQQKKSDDEEKSGDEYDEKGV